MVGIKLAGECFSVVQSQMRGAVLRMLGKPPRGQRVVVSLPRPRQPGLEDEVRSLDGLTLPPVPGRTRPVTIRVEEILGRFGSKPGDVAMQLEEVERRLAKGKTVRLEVRSPEDVKEAFGKLRELQSKYRAGGKLEVRAHWDSKAEKAEILGTIDRLKSEHQRVKQEQRARTAAQVAAQLGEIERKLQKGETVRLEFRSPEVIKERLGKLLELQSQYGAGGKLKIRVFWNSKEEKAEILGLVNHIKSEHQRARQEQQTSKAAAKPVAAEEEPGPAKSGGWFKSVSSRLTNAARGFMAGWRGKSGV